MTWGENFWKERYENTKAQYDLLEQENDEIFMAIRQIKITASGGDIVDAIAQIHTISTTGRAKKQKVIAQDGGYQWNQR